MMSPQSPKAYCKTYSFRYSRYTLHESLDTHTGYMHAASQQPQPELRGKEAENKPLYQFVIPEPGM